MKKIKFIVFAILIALGCYSLVTDIAKHQITIDTLIILLSLVLMSTFIENSFSYNKGVFLVLEIGRDVLGGYGSFPILNNIPISLPRLIIVVIVFAVTAILAITMSDDVSDAEEK